MLKSDHLELRGSIKVEHWRDDKLFATYYGHNAVTIEGKNEILLDVAFRAQTETAAYYMGLIDNLNYTALDEGDTYDDIDQAGNGWDEFKDYDFAAVSTDRATWVPNAASSKAISNSGTPSVFDITGAGTVKGIFLCGEPVGGGASPDTQGDHHADGLLWSAALFNTGNVVVAASDQLKVTYTIQT